ncbi:GFA family protein [Altererythrobacter sp. MF3-039]|uniref:GFA family protein n=1 Tax=Altererythrobacter sp. MF3-039 TaxID=3252901 RepID=UPI00390C7AFE
MEGRCACGSIRYELTKPSIETSWCHCRNCQRISGAPGAVYTTLPRSGFTVRHGTENLGRVRLTKGAERMFCSNCGSPLATIIDDEPDTVDVTVATLDDPAAYPPEFHIFCNSKTDWFEPRDTLPRYARSRRDERP